MKRESIAASANPSGRLFYWLLLSLLLAVIVGPLFEGRLADAFEHACLTAVCVTGVWANRARRRVFWTGLVISALAVPLTWSTLVVDASPVTVGQQATLIIFCGFNAYAILLAVVNDYAMTKHSIAGVICAYFLLGLAWALAYAMIDHLDPTSIAFSARRVASAREGFSQFLYFSFVTMSTLGYGDITPRTPVAETATWLQSVMGQFYMAVLVARLINALPGPQPRQATKGAPAAA